MSRASKNTYHPHGDANNFTTTEKALDDLDTAVGTKLDASAYTAADVLAKLITVDGAGSGLDADLLDGLNSSVLSKVARTLNFPTTAYTFALTDAGNVVCPNNSSAANYTIPPVASVAWVTGTQIDLLQISTGAITIVAGSGVTLLSFNSLVTLGGINAGATLLNLSTNTWALFGNLK